MSGETFKVAGWYEFHQDQVQPGAAQVINAPRFISMCREWAEYVLAQAGVETPPASAFEYHRLRDRFALDSIETVAITLGILSYRLEVSRAGAIGGGVPTRAVDELIQLSAMMTQAYEVVVATHRGLPTAATRGRAVVEGSEVGVEGRRKQARAQVLADYGAFALQVADELKAKRGSVSRAEIARRVRERGEQTPGVRLPRDNTAIETFLKKNGH